MGDADCLHHPAVQPGLLSGLGFDPGWAELADGLLTPLTGVTGLQQACDRRALEREAARMRRECPAAGNRLWPPPDYEEELVGLTPIAACDRRDFPAAGHGTERVQARRTERMMGVRHAVRVRPAWLSAARSRPSRRSDDDQMILFPLGPGPEMR